MSEPRPSMRVAVVIVSYHPDIEELDKVVRAHVANGPAALILLDNGSGMGAALRQLMDRCCSPGRCQVLELGSNLGMGAALNRGVENARALGCTHVALFDQDSVPEANLIERLTDTLFALEQQGRKVAAVGPMQRDARTGSEYAQRRVRGMRMQVLWPSRQSTDVFEVGFVITSGSLIDLRVFDEVGPMREDFFIDGIDIEWGYRARSLGRISYCSRDAVLLHELGDRRRKVLGREFSAHGRLRTYYQTRNMVRMCFLPELPRRVRWAETLYFLSMLPVHFMASGWHLRDAWQGLRDGWLGRMGRRDGCSAIPRRIMPISAKGDEP